ncbi:glycosyltransferase [Clostridium saudiense]|uniref:glycosyltransferase n=1 Tax=Clostridium saudiense TaxID=1414720 RepID=UPI0018ABE712|nr:glycosyltransferase [Clostridium saudiense]
MKNNNIVAGIIVFNPELNRLAKCIENLLNELEKVIIFDNSNVKITESFFDKFPNESVIYMDENGNKGISYGLNRVMEKGKEMGYDWVITMDQDSIIPVGLIDSYAKFINDEDVAIISPQVIDKRRKYMKIVKEPNIEYIDEAITSASCTRIKHWEKVGKFDELLFIDLVDNEFCKRIIESGYKILRINECILDQEFGEIYPKQPIIQNFYIWLGELFNNENIAKLSYKKSVNPLRVYYTNRNIIYVNKKMKNYGKVGYGNYNCKSYIGFLLCFSMPSILRGKHKFRILKAIIKGIIDGIKIKVEPWCI